MLKGIIKYSLIIVGLLIVALLAAPFFIDVNVYKQQIEKAVKHQTGRDLTIGKMNASLFPWIGVELDDVHLSNRQGFGKRDFLSVNSLQVQLAVAPLLSKKIEIQQFELIRPKVYLQRRADGSSNWDDLAPAKTAQARPDKAIVLASASSPAPSESNAAMPLLAALQAEQLSLTDGEVTWVDGKSKPVILSDLNVMLRDVQLKHPVAVNISGKLSGNAFALDASVGPIGDIGRINPATLPLQGHLKAENIRLQPFQQLISGWPQQLGNIDQAAIDMSTNIEQRPNGIRMSDGELQLHAAHALKLTWTVEMPKADQLKLNRAVFSVDAKKLLRLKGDVRHLTTLPLFNIRVDGEPVARTWLTGFVPDLQAMYGDHPSPWKQLQFSALLAGGSKQLNIRDLQLKLDNELLQASGDVVYQGPDIHLRVNAKQLHMDPWLPQGKKETQPGSATISSWDNLSLIRNAIAAAKISPEPDLRFLKSWKVATKLRISRLYLHKLEMRNFSATINGSGGRFHLNPLSFNLSAGKVTEKASIDVRPYPARWKESVHIVGVQAGPLLKTLADMDMISGTMAMDTNFHATGLTQAAVASLNGRGNVLFENGKIKGFDIAGAIRKFTNPAAYQQGPKETDFAQLSGSFHVINGVANNQDLFMASPLLRVTGKGQVNLVSKVMDYHVKPRVIGVLKGQGDTGMHRGLTIPLHIKGPFAAPKIRPEINARTLIDNAPALLNKGKLGGVLGGAKLGGVLGQVLGGRQANTAAKQGGSRAGAQIQPKSKPATQPATQQQKLMNSLGGLLQGF